MSTPFSGGVITVSTFLGSTTANLIGGIQSALTASGWTVVSGGGTTNLLMQTATTPQGLAMNFRFKDNLLNNSNAIATIQLSIESISGSIIGTNSSGGSAASLAVDSTISYTVICCPYNFFILKAGVFSNLQSFAFGGVPWIPSFSGITQCGYCCGQSYGYSNTGTGSPNTFRNNRGGAFQNVIMDQQLIVQTNYISNYNSSFNNAAAANCFQQWGIPYAPFNSNGINSPMNTFFSGQYASFDPWIGWGLTTASNPGLPLIIGMMWNCIFICDGSVVGDTAATFNGHNWYAITNAQNPALWVATS